jgi:thiol-disulfide isomerase/thioredoxin
VRLALLLVAGCAGTAAAPVPPKTAPIALGADIPAALPAGYVSVVDYWADWCGACTVVSGMLAVQVAKEPRVVVRKIDVGNDPRIPALPRFEIYDRQRRLRFILVANDCLRAPDLARQLLAEP